MKKLILIFFLFTIHSLSAQNLKVIDAQSGELMAGASVSLSNSQNEKTEYLSTDKNGQIALKESYFAKQSYLVVRVSFIGYEPINDTLYTSESKTYSINPKSYLIDDVVVTAQYSPTSVEKSIHKIKVISRQKIEKMAAVNLQDVLTNELNVRLSQDNILGSGMSLQGISGQNVKILIDGVPVIGRLDGQIDLNQINLNQIERIEIVEGPLSVNYGSNALAGTINIITVKEQQSKLISGLNAYTENAGTYNLEAYAGFSLSKKQNLRLSVGRNYFDGWNPGDDFLPSLKAERADSGRVKQWKPKEQYFGRFQYNYSLNKLLLSYKTELFDEVIKNSGYPRRTTTSYIAFDDYYYTQRIDNALFAQGKINEKWNLNWTSAYNHYERVKEARRKDLVSLESTRIPETATNDMQDTSTFNLFMSRGSISSTRDSALINYEVGYDISIENASGKRIEGKHQQLSDYALFASSEILLNPNIVLKPALRYAYNTKYESPLTPSVNAKFHKNNSIFRFSYAKGFRAPSLKELYFNFNDINHSLFGNNNLKAERSNNYSGSFLQKFLVKEMLIKIEVSGFYNHIYNQISFAQQNTNSGDSLVYFNIGKNETKGVNLNLSVNRNRLILNLGGAYTGRLNRLEEESSLEKFSYSTELNASLSYELKKPRLTIAAFAKHQGELPGFSYDNNNDIVKRTTESYQLVDLSLSKKVWKEKLSITTGCKNLLNVQNIQSGVSEGAHSGGSSVSVARGRTVFLKIGLNLHHNPSPKNP